MLVSEALWVVATGHAHSSAGGKGLVAGQHLGCQVGKSSEEPPSAVLPSDPEAHLRESIQLLESHPQIHSGKGISISITIHLNSQSSIQLCLQVILFILQRGIHVSFFSYMVY